MHLDKQHPRPIYLQLKELLQSQIEQGVYLAHQKLPSERDLCQHHNLSRMTARRALKELIAEGFAYTRIGKGTFVNHVPDRSDKVVGQQISENRQTLDGDTYHAHYSQKLIAPLLSFDGIGVEQAVGEMMAIHSLETIASRLFPEVIRHLEQRWHQGELSLLLHNYAITTLRSQLIAMMNAATMTKGGRKILLACAPRDQHDIGLIAIALSLRRRGYVVTYLGPNLVAHEFGQTADIVQPELICLSAATVHSAESLQAFSQKYRARLSVSPENGLSKKPLLAFGGAVFSQNPHLSTDVRGLYLGDTLEQAITKIEALLAVNA